MTAAAQPTGITRRNYGRGHGYRIDDVKVPGVTTILGATMPKQALINWAAETTAGYAVDYWAELSELPPSQRLKRLMKARYEDVDRAANRGTEVHRLAEAHMAGEEIEIPDELEGHIRSYERFIAEWDPQPVGVELTVAHRTMGYCGTVDLVADLADGARWLLDYKTSRSGIFPETALQLTAYRNAEVYVDASGAEHPMADLGIQRAGAIHITADGYRFLPIDDGAEPWTYFRHLAWLYRRVEQLPEWIGTELRPLRAVS